MKTLTISLFYLLDDVARFCLWPCCFNCPKFWFKVPLFCCSTHKFQCYFATLFHLKYCSLPTAKNVQSCILLRGENVVGKSFFIVEMLFVRTRLSVIAHFTSYESSLYLEILSLKDIKE